MNSMLTWNSWRAEMAVDVARDARWRRAEARREDFMVGDDRGIVFRKRDGFLVVLCVLEDFGQCGKVEDGNRVWDKVFK